MAKTKSTETLAPSEPEATVRLIDVLQSLAKEVEALTHQVGTLTDQAHVLTEAIDDVRMELEYAIRNLCH